MSKLQKMANLFRAATTAAGRAGHAAEGRSPYRTGRRAGGRLVGSGWAGAALRPDLPALWCRRCQLYKERKGGFEFFV